MNVTITDITKYQSYTYVIRELFLKTLAALPFFAAFTIRRTRRVPIRTNDLPVLALYIVDENMAPDGDADAGDIRFIHTARLGFSAIIVNNDEQAAEQMLDACFWAIMNGLWCNQYLMSMVDTVNPHTGIGNPDGVRIEGIVRGVRKHVYGNGGANNEFPFAEMQYEVYLTYRSMWDPIITDTLDIITMKTQFPSDHDGLPTSVDQIEVVYDLAAPSSFAVSAPRTASVATPFSFTVTALDAHGNIDPAYAGSVHFTSSDGAAVLPVDSTLTNGTGSFSATLNTAGNQTITATDSFTQKSNGASNGH